MVDPRRVWRWLGIALLAALGLVVMNSPRVLESRINPEVPLAPPRAVHNATVTDGKVWVGPNLGPHAEVDWDAVIKPHRRYLIALTLDNPGEFVSPRVHVDLYAPGYDHPEQNFQVTVPSAATGYRVVELAGSGAAPPAVSLRVFHFDPGARVRVTGVSLRQISWAYDAALAFFVIGLAIALAGLCASCAAAMRLRNLRSAAGPAAIGGWWLAAALLSILVVIVWNGLLGAPQIFADEYAYWASISALHTGEWAGLREAHYQDMPNRLFFAAYGLTAIAKHPIAAARILDALWLLAGLVPLYLVAATCNVLVAGLFVGLAWVLGPIGTYSAYFTPEVMFAAVLALACALAALALESHAISLAIASAVAFAALPYVKPNGWVPVAAMALYVVIHGWDGGRKERLQFLRGFFVAVASFAAAWIALKWALPDAPSRTRSLGMYSGVSLRAMQILETPGKFALIARFLFIHLAIVTCLAGPALAYGLRVVMRPRLHPELDRSERLARIVAGSSTLVLLALVAMTAVFSASIAGLNAADTASRLHTRYYAFAIPLVILGFVASPVSREWSARKRNAVLLLWAAASMISAFALPQFGWSAFDSPDLFVVGVVPAFTIGLFGLAGAGLALLIRRSKPAALQFATLVTWVSVAIAAGIAVRTFQFEWQVNYVDRAGRFVEMLAEETGSTIVVVTDRRERSSWIYRLASYAPSHTRFTKSDQMAVIVAEGLQSGALLVGAPKDLPRGGVVALARFGRLEVVRVSDPTAAAAASPAGGVLPRGDALVVSFGGAITQGVRFSGMHAPEGWGAWSAASEIRIDLPFSVRGELRLALEGRALGPNVGKPLTLTIGGQSRTFTLADPLTTVDLRILVAEPEHSITISGIEPVAAKALGLPHDDRQLGIGLSSIRIAPQ